MKAPNITKGRKISDWVARTYCDFNDPTRKNEIRTHYSMETALRSWNTIRRIHYHCGRIWIETKFGEIIADTQPNYQI